MKNIIFNVHPLQTCMVVERESSQLSKKILTCHGEHACDEHVEPRHCKALGLRTGLVEVVAKVPTVIASRLSAVIAGQRRSNLLTHPPHRSPFTVFLLTFTFITFNLLIAAAFVMMSGVEAFSQGNVGINSTGNNPDASSVLDIAADGATKGGLLIPRVSLTSTTDVTTIASPANSLMVYNTNAAMLNGNGVGFYYYSTSAVKWIYVDAAANGPGTAGQVLTSQGPGSQPQWTTLSTSGGCVPLEISNTTWVSVNWMT